jgi:transposase
MPAVSISMRKIKEVLRLRYNSHLSIQQIASSLGLSKSTVSSYIKQAESAAINWPLSEDMDEADLAKALLGCRIQTQSGQYAKPDFNFVHQELKRKGVTLQLLWEEYASEQKGRAYSYTRFTELYAQWRGKLKLSLRQTHRAGERMFVDYAGQTVAVVDPNSGEVRQAQIFVAVLGASNYSYAEATYTQSLPDWISSHQRAMAYFGVLLQPEVEI